MALHATAAMSNPVRHEIGLAGVTGGLLGVAKDQRPQVIAGSPQCERCFAVRRGDVSAHRVALVAMNAAFALFEVNRIAREIPVH